MVSVWILLTRHVSDSSVKKIKHLEGAENLDGEGIEDDVFLTCHVYSNTDGARVFVACEKFVSGLYTNDPHSLIRFDVDPKTLHERSGTVAYTLGNIF